MILDYYKKLLNEHKNLDSQDKIKLTQNQALQLIFDLKFVHTLFDLKSEFLVDTGAPVNVIDEITYAKFANKAPLEKCNISFYGYSSEKPLPILGQFVTQVQYKERSATAGFIVIKGNEQNLLSFKSSKDLGIILVDSPETPIK